MHSVTLTHSPWTAERGFTLVEIMIVSTIIGLLAALALPAIRRSHQSAQNTRFTTDLRAFRTAFETYALDNSGWPPNASNSVVPTGMTGSLSSNWTVRNTLGGLWNWDRNLNGIAAGISTTGVTVSDTQMESVDRMVDDGDLSTGSFRKVNGRFTFLLEE